ncbi:MAG: hypothetical protein F4Z08_10430 [Chloroflexi bacterium]|nr:hypothetical protein [Chloroflexota bacterium]
MARARSCLVRLLFTLLAFAIAVAVTAGAAILFLDGNEADAPTAPAEPTDPASPSAARPETARTADVLDAPGSAGRPRGTLDAGTPLRIEGRSADGMWLAVAALAVDGPDTPSPVTGWVPAGAVASAGDINALEIVDARAYRLPVETPTAPPGPEATPTPPPDRPDLVVREVFARENHLVVVVANEGSANADAGGVIEVSVNGGPFIRIDTGKALRPGDELERVVAGESVQLRSHVAVTLRAWGLIEEDTDNNTFESDVAPDTFNDIEVSRVAIDPDGGHVVVEVRNNSPIPLAGNVTLAVRESGPGGAPLFSAEFTLEVAAGATSRYDLRELTGVEDGSVSVTVSTDAISDADSANNTYPR